MLSFKEIKGWWRKENSIQIMDGRIWVEFSNKNKKLNKRYEGLSIESPLLPRIMEKINDDVKEMAAGPFAEIEGKKLISAINRLNIVLEEEDQIWFFDGYGFGVSEEERMLNPQTKKVVDYTVFPKILGAVELKELGGIFSVFDPKILKKALGYFDRKEKIKIWSEKGTSKWLMEQGEEDKKISVSVLGISGFNFQKEKEIKEYCLKYKEDMGIEEKKK